MALCIDKLLARNRRPRPRACSTTTGRRIWGVPTVGDYRWAPAETYTEVLLAAGADERSAAVGSGGGGDARLKGSHHPEPAFGPGLA